MLHPLPAKILEYRQYAKLKSTYVDALPEMICPETGRVHASFNQVVTATGRLSSNDPNLQNIPVRTEEGREIRSAFVPGHEGWVLLAADYSQIELRVLAHFSGDARLCEAFAHNEDIHARVASQVNGVPLDRGDSRDASGGQSRQFRRGLRSEPFRARPRAGHRPGGGGKVYRQLFRGVSGHRKIPRHGYWRNVGKMGMLELSWDGDVPSAACAKGPAGSEILPNAPR